MRTLCLLGATGSIGSSVLDLVRRHPDRLRIGVLCAHRNTDLLARLCAEFRPELAVIADRDCHARARDALADAGASTRLEAGPEALAAAAEHPDVDTVVAGIVGAAGLEPTLRAVAAGHRVLLANKEALVMTGGLFMQAAKDSGARILPVDSEHNAVFQCLAASGQRDAIESITLTASGGPFRSWSGESLEQATPEQACNHPTWSMGQKISVDSATLMNKGLEVIEACHLFGLAEDRVRVLIHPESIVHGLVSYADGSTLAQLGLPDMRTPLANGLFWPDRCDSGVATLDLAELGRLNFEHPDTERFPCLDLARRALRAGGLAPAVLNAANEAAVQSFLDGRVGFGDIARLNARALEEMPAGRADSVEAVLAADARARSLIARLAQECVPESAD